MKDFATLKLLDRFRPLFSKLGVDYGAMRLILRMKLTMDRRRASTLFNATSGGAGAEKETNHFIKSMLLYGVMGLLIMPVLLLGLPPFFKMTIVFALLMFMIMMALISDFSTVLLDLRDKTVLLTKPVSPRTVAMAKLVHIVLYLLGLSGAFAAAPLVAIAIRHGPLHMALFAVELLGAVVLVLTFTALVYLAMLRLFDGEKLKDMINYAQIGFSVAMMAGYQFAIRSFEFASLAPEFEPKLWQLLVPPVWFGAPFAWLSGGVEAGGGGFVATLSVMAFVMPVLALVVYVKLMPTFENSLQKLSQAGAVRTKGKRKLGHSLARALTTAGEERTFFQFATAMMGREREFKLKAYPSVALGIVFPVVYLFIGADGFSLEGLSSGRGYLAIYLTMLAIPSVVMILRYAGGYKGAWIYRAAPVHDYGLAHRGTLKAFLVKLYMPCFLAVGIFMSFVFGLRIVPDLAAALLASMLFTVVCWLPVRKVMPFSEPFQTGRGGDALMVVPLMLLMGVFAGVHYLCTLFSFGVWLYAAVLAGLNVLVWRNGFGARRRGSG